MYLSGRVASRKNCAELRQNCAPELRGVPHGDPRDVRYPLLHYLRQRVPLALVLRAPALERRAHGRELIARERAVEVCFAARDERRDLVVGDELLERDDPRRLVARPLLVPVEEEASQNDCAELRRIAPESRRIARRTARRPAATARAASTAELGHDAPVRRVDVARPTAGGVSGAGCTPAASAAGAPAQFSCMYQVRRALASVGPLAARWVGVVAAERLVDDPDEAAHAARPRAAVQHVRLVGVTAPRAARPYSASSASRASAVRGGRTAGARRRRRRLAARAARRRALLRHERGVLPHSPRAPTGRSSRPRRHMCGLRYRGWRGRRAASGPPTSEEAGCIFGEHSAGRRLQGGRSPT